MSFFSDPRYRTERILMVCSIPVAVLLLGGLVWLLVTQDTTPPERPTILTADMVETSTVETGPELPTALESAMELIRKRNYDEARALLEESLTESQKPAEVLNLLGLLELEEKNPAGAEEFFTQAMELSTEGRGFLYFNRAEAKRRQGKMEDVMEDYDAAVQLSPSEPRFSNARYLFLIEQGEVDRVRSSIMLKMQLGLVQNAGQWVMPAAALALLDGDYDEGATLLQAGVAMLSPVDFDFLIEHPAFEPYRQNQQILPFFIPSSSVRRAGGSQ